VRQRPRMPRYCEERVIDAPAATVFDVITDLDAYAQWNPWIVKASGTPDEGATIRVKSLVGGRKLRVEHRILRSQRPREFRWCDLGWFTKLAYGERARWLSERPDGRVGYKVELSITGVAAALVGAVLGRSLAGGLRAETDALKARAESLARRAA
jgi:uncharacterized protein YndB with AHSA1/START domain